MTADTFHAEGRIVGVDFTDAGTVLRVLLDGHGGHIIPSSVPVVVTETTPPRLTPSH